MRSFFSICETELYDKDSNVYLIVRSENDKRDFESVLPMKNNKEKLYRIENTIYCRHCCYAIPIFSDFQTGQNKNRQMEILLLDGVCVCVFVTAAEYNKIISFMHIYFTFLQQPKPFLLTIDTTFSM